MVPKAGDLRRYRAHYDVTAMPIKTEIFELIDNRKIVVTGLLLNL